MEALNYIKEHHKPFLGKINYDVVDELGHNYAYYEKLYCKQITLISDKILYNGVMYLMNNYINHLYIASNDNLKYIYTKKYLNIHFDSMNNNLKIIDSINSFLYLDYPLINLEKVKCHDMIINTIQPIKKIKLLYYKYKKNYHLINDIDNLMIKCPQLQYIKINYRYLNKIIKMKFYYDDKWNLDIVCDMNYQLKFPNLSKCPIIQNIKELNVNLGYYCSYFNNINSLEINLYYKYKNKNFLVIIDENIKNLVINDNINILFIFNISLDTLKITKSFNKRIYIITKSNKTYLKQQLEQYLLNYHNKYFLKSISIKKNKSFKKTKYNDNEFINIDIKDLKEFMKNDYELIEDDKYFIYNKK